MHSRALVADSEGKAGSPGPALPSPFELRVGAAQSRTAAPTRSYPTSTYGQNSYQAKKSSTLTCIQYAEHHTSLMMARNLATLGSTVFNAQVSYNEQRPNFTESLAQICERYLDCLHLRK
jgi:hypothetical protein